jgi:hypothetical protein
VAFPLRPCEEDVAQHTCTALHVASTIFVCMWILTGLAVIVLIITVTLFDRNRQQNNARWWEETIGNQAVESSLRLTQLPDPLREQIVNNLPTTHEPPADGEPCAICYDVDTQSEWCARARGGEWCAGCRLHGFRGSWLVSFRGSWPGPGWWG